MQHAGGDEDVVAGTHGGRLPVQDRFAFTFDEEENLIALVGLFADLLAGLERHDDELRVLARLEDLPEELVLSCELDVVALAHARSLNARATAFRRGSRGYPRGVTRTTRLQFRACYLITLASGTAAARLAADFRALGAVSSRLGPLAIVLQLLVLLCWLLARPISLAGFAACTALAGREGPAVSTRR